MVDKKLSFEIELMKWLAILAIYIFHFSDTIVRYSVIYLNPILEKIFHIGPQGIHIFFMISSFFLYIKYVQNCKDFHLIIRIKKLYPQYFISVIFIILIYFLNGKTFDISVIVVNIVPIMRNLFEEYIRSINGNWWFLHTLIEFYIFFKLINHRLKKISKFNLVIGTIIIYFSYVSFYTFYLNVSSQNLHPFSAFFLNYIYDFTIGIILAKLYLEGKINLNYSPFKLLFMGIIFELLGYSLTKIGIFGYNINDLFFSFGILFTLVAVSRFLVKLKEKITVINIFVKNTNLIYFIYLIHHPIIIITLNHFNVHNYFTLITLFISTLIFTIFMSIMLLKINIAIEKLIYAKS